jgi:hypothetical protein
MKSYQPPALSYQQAGVLPFDELGEKTILLSS